MIKIRLKAIFAIIELRSLKFIHIIHVFLGPDLPIPLFGHSMVPLGFGQAILGGSDTYLVSQRKIYHVTCSKKVCELSTLSKELSVSRFSFVAIPIPDSISGCISDSKLDLLVLTMTIFLMISSTLRNDVCPQQNNYIRLISD